MFYMTKRIFYYFCDVGDDTPSASRVENAEKVPVKKRQSEVTTKESMAKKFEMHRREQNCE